MSIVVPTLHPTTPLAISGKFLKRRRIRIEAIVKKTNYQLSLSMLSANDTPRTFRGRLICRLFKVRCRSRCEDRALIDIYLLRHRKFSSTTVMYVQSSRRQAAGCGGTSV
jgi:hypothetical protein